MRFLMLCSLVACGCLDAVDELRPQEDAGVQRTGGGSGAGATGGGGVSGGGATGGGATGGGVTGGGVTGGGVTGGGGGSGGVPGSAVPPSSTTFMWQGQQKHFTGCDGQLAFAVGATAICYGHVDGSMRCAGRIGATNFGNTFSVTTERDVDQILISRNVGATQGLAQGMCVHRLNGTAGCLGSYNWNGQYGLGHDQPVNTFQAFTQRTDLIALATGTWDQICALDTNGGVVCAGYMFGNTPAAQSGSMLRRFYVTEFGTTTVDDVNVFRVSNGRSTCRVNARGLECTLGSMIAAGTPGQVVDGLRYGPPGPFGDERCWLERGNVYCTSGERFMNGNVMAMAADFDTTTLCAVYDDGSLWCRGSSEEGKTGLGSSAELIADTQVQPPGSVKICR